jgi:hypothetical protein
MVIFNSYVKLPEGKQNGTSPFSMGGLVRWKNHRTIAGRSSSLRELMTPEAKDFHTLQSMNLLRNVVNPMRNSFDWGCLKTHSWFLFVDGLFLG